MHAQATIDRANEDAVAIKAYQEKWGLGPFLAADVVIQSTDNQILLIRRGAAPGRGLLALPGGFLEPGETFFEAALRELMEETGIGLDGRPFDDFELSVYITGDEVFDDPQRDPRARVISRAYHLMLDMPAERLTVQANDDAAEVLWAPMTLLGKDLKAADFYADHFRVVQVLTK